MNHSMKLTKISLAVMLATGAAASVSAQEGLFDTVVVSADRQERAIQDVPASIHAISLNTLDTFRHVHISQVMNTVPGVVFNRNNGQESLIGIRSGVLTGAGSCGSVQMSQDGIPLRGVGFCNVNQLFESNSEQAASIEVVRGPGSILFGANALHGAINVINPALTGDAGGTIALDAGPHDYGRLNVGYNSGGDEHRFGAYFNRVSDGGYRDNSGYDQDKLNVSHRYDAGNFRVTTVFAATNLDQETASYLSGFGFGSYKNDDLRKLNQDPDAFRDASSRRLHARIEGSTDSGNWMVTPYYRDTDMTFLMHFLPATPLEQNGHDSLGVQSMYSFNSSDAVNWTVGFDMEQSEGYLKQSQAEAGGLPFPPGQQYDFVVDVDMMSPYVLGKFQVSEQDQFSFGLRLETLEYDYDNLMVDGNTWDDGVTTCAPAACRYSRPSDRSDDFDNATAQLGWIHDLDTSSQVFANLSYAFRAPQAAELYRLQVGQTVAELDSEQVESIEGGYRATRDNWSYALTAYYMEKDDVIFQDSDRNNLSGGETRHLGLEFNALVALTDNISLNLVTSYARHTYENSIDLLGSTVDLAGNDMDTAPEMVGNIQLDWRLNEMSSLNFEWVHMGSYYTDESNLHSYPGHDVFNVRYRYDLENDWFVSARVQNLFDTKYAERADYTGFGGDRYFIGEPASLYFTVGSRF